MNAIFFGLKRAHHGALRITRRALARLGLTAARFDLLYVVNESGSRRVLQRGLRRALGVSAPTVSRMVDSLEALGLVGRERCCVDRRMRYVRLTEAGLRCIRKAIRRFVRSGWAQLAVDGALSPDRWFDESECLYAMDICESTLRRFRRAYGDIATLSYRWHPDDEDVSLSFDFLDALDP
jgi:DNA-binding MarR family transcriptional regulator